MAGGDNQRRSGPQSREWRQLFRKQFRKTKMCRFFPSGECRYGQDCPYAHDESEIQHAPDLTKTALCEAFAKGQCNKPSDKCQFAHGPEELRTTEAFSSSQLCSKRLGGAKDGDTPSSQQQRQQPQFQQQMLQQHQQMEAMFGGASFMPHPGSNNLKLPIAMAGGQAYGGPNMLPNMQPPPHAPQLPPFFDPSSLNLGMKPSKREEESPGVSTATPGTTQHADSFNRTPLRNGRGFPGVNEHHNYWKEDDLSDEGRWGEPAMVYVDGVPIGSRHPSPERGADRAAWPRGDQSPSKAQGRMRSPQRYPDTPDYWGRTPTSTAAASPNQSPSPRRRGHGPVDSAALAFHLQGLSSVFGGNQQASQSTPAQMPNLNAWLHQSGDQQQQQQSQPSMPAFPQMMPYLQPMADGATAPGQAQWGMANNLSPFGGPMAVSAQQ